MTAPGPTASPAISGSGNGGSSQPLWNSATNGDVTTPRTAINDTSGSFPAVVSGDMLVVFYRATSSGPKKTVHMQGASQVPVTSTLAKVGLYVQNADLSLDLLAASANVSPLFGGAFGDILLSFLTSAQVAAGQIYGFAVLQVAATPGSLTCANYSNVFGPGPLPTLAAVVHGQADLPAHVTAGAQALINVGPYASIST